MTSTERPDPYKPAPLLRADNDTRGPEIARVKELALIMRGESHPKLRLDSLQRVAGAEVDPRWTYDALVHGLHPDAPENTNVVLRTLTELARYPEQRPHVVACLAAGSMYLGECAERIRVLEVLSAIPLRSAAGGAVVQALASTGQAAERAIKMLLNETPGGVEIAPVLMHQRSRCGVHTRSSSTFLQRVNSCAMEICDREMSDLRHDFRSFPVNPERIQELLYNLAFDASERQMRLLSVLAVDDGGYPFISDLAASALHERITALASPGDGAAHRWAPFLLYALALPGCSPSTKLLLKALDRTGADLSSAAPFLDRLACGYRDRHQPALEILALTAAARADDSRRELLAKVCAERESQRLAPSEEIDRALMMLAVGEDDASTDARNHLGRLMLSQNHEPSAVLRRRKIADYAIAYVVEHPFWARLLVDLVFDGSKTNLAQKRAAWRALGEALPHLRGTDAELVKGARARTWEQLASDSTGS